VQSTRCLLQALITSAARRGRLPANTSFSPIQRRSAPIALTSCGSARRRPKLQGVKRFGLDKDRSGLPAQADPLRRLLAGGATAGERSRAIHVPTGPFVAAPVLTLHEVRRFLRKVVSPEMQGLRRVQIAVLAAMTGIRRKHL
jgi:hypothetical protein